jgi:hypothetical protein
MTLKEIPKEWYTERAATSFARAYNGEGSYYCPGPDCWRNMGSVWYGSSPAPLKVNALCDDCKRDYVETSQAELLTEDPDHGE